MNWFKEANKDIIGKIKRVLKTHPFTQALADYYNIPIDDVDNHLSIEVADLKGQFAEGNGRVMRLDKRLLDDQFFSENFHFIIHEFFHWLKRRSEELFYLNDSEEVQSFVLQMTWMMVEGKSKEEVIREIYPIIKTHYKNMNKAKFVFSDMLQKAVDLYEIYESGGKISM